MSNTSNKPCDNSRAQKLSDIINVLDMARDIVERTEPDDIHTIEFKLNSVSIKLECKS